MCVGRDGDGGEENAHRLLNGDGKKVFTLQLYGDHGLNVYGIEFALEVSRVRMMEGEIA